MTTIKTATATLPISADVLYGFLSDLSKHRVFLEPAAIGEKNCRLTCCFLPAPDHEIHIPWIDVQPIAGPLGGFGRHQRRARAEEGIVDYVARDTIVQNRTAHECDRLLSAVSGCGFLPLSAKGIEVRNFPERRLGAVSAPVRVLLFSHCIPARLMLPVIITATQGEVLLGPDNLGANPQSRGFESSRHFAGMNTGMPHVGNISGKESVCLGPVRPVIVQNRAGLPLPA